MRFIFTHIFWGLLLIIIGISAILKSFNINIPLVRVIFAFLFIFLGISILVGYDSGINNGNNIIIFSDNSYKVTSIEKNEYNIIFGKSIIDLSNVQLNNNEKITINVIFGSGEILLNPDTRVSIKANSAFGNTDMPNNSNITFGELNYQSNINNEKHEDRPVIFIETNTVFASLKILNRAN